MEIQRALQSLSGALKPRLSLRAGRDTLSLLSQKGEGGSVGISSVNCFERTRSRNVSWPELEGAALPARTRVLEDQEPLRTEAVISQPGVMACACNPSTWEAETDAP